jgi:hypothetical protein
VSILPIWRDRVREEANLFNPYFIGFAIRQVARTYDQERGERLPWALPFLFVPLLLHEHSRESLPYTSRTDLVVWLTDNPDIRFLTPHRVRLMRPYVQEALLVATRDGLLTIDRSSLSIGVGDRRVVQARLDRTELVAGDVLKACPKLGRWLARNGSWQYQLTLWGVAL